MRTKVLCRHPLQRTKPVIAKQQVTRPTKAHDVPCWCVGPLWLRRSLQCLPLRQRPCSRLQNPAWGFCHGVEPSYTWPPPFLLPPVLPSVTVFPREPCLLVKCPKQDSFRVSFLPPGMSQALAPGPTCSSFWGSWASTEPSSNSTLQVNRFLSYRPSSLSNFLNKLIDLPFDCTFICILSQFICLYQFCTYISLHLISYIFKYVHVCIHICVCTYMCVYIYL